MMKKAHSLLFLTLLTAIAIVWLLKSSLLLNTKYFPFRKSLLSLHTSITYHLFGDSPRDNIIVGKEGWFFRGRGKQRLTSKDVVEFNYLTEVSGKESDKHINGWVKTLTTRQDFLAEQGIPYLFFVAPKKALIYPEYLPNSLRLRQEKNSPTFLEQLNNTLSTESRVNTVDLIKLFRSKKLTQSSPLYLKTDGHWNTIGAFIAYQEIIEKVNSLIPELKLSPLSWKQFELKWKTPWVHQGFAEQFGIEIKEPFPKLLAQKENPLKKVAFSFKQIATLKSHYWITPYIEPLKGKFATALLDGQRYSASINPQSKELKTILLMGDSFLMKLFPFFAAHTEVLLRIRSERDFPKGYFQNSFPKPDIVIQEVAQRYLGVKPPQR